jgi:methyltransferase (TIGR00027 family)
MKEKDASFTAMMTAYMRAYHSMHATNKVFDDFLAYRLLPNEKRALIEQYLIGEEQLESSFRTESCSEQTDNLMSLIPTVISRARYTEDTLEKAVKQGVKQYVILGAGLDTFAFRQPEMMECLEVFEVDHPATQGFKIQRIAELGWKHPARLHFVPIDFSTERLEASLNRSSSYDPEVKTFFSWLGVTYFLTQNEVLATLRSITKVAHAGSIIVFDYFDNDIFLTEKWWSQDMQDYWDFLQEIGEPISMGFNPSTLNEDLNTLGFCLLENLSSVDIEERYFQERTDGCHAQGYEYIASATIK